MKFTLLLFFCMIGSSAFSQTDTSVRVVGVDLNLDTTEVFKAVEVQSSYGGDWKRHLVNNLKANVPIINGAPAGTYTVLVQFIVDKNGKVSNISPLTKHGYGMEDEVIRVIKKSGRWNPAIQGGRFVKAWKSQSVTFVVAAK